MDYGVWEAVVIYCLVIFNNVLLLQNLSLDNSYQPIPLISCFTSGCGVGIGNFIRIILRCSTGEPNGELFFLTLGIPYLDTFISKKVYVELFFDIKDIVYAIYYSYFLEINFRGTRVLNEITGL